MNVFCLPDLGEGLTEAEIVSWHVKVGESVSVDQPLVSVETAKAVVEVPSPVSGKLLKYFGEIGDIIQTGKPLAEFHSKHASQPATVAGQLEQDDTVFFPEAFLKPAMPKHTTPKFVGQPLKGIRRTMAKTMAKAHAQVVPVSVMEEVVLPPCFDLKKVTVKLIQAMCFALQKEPSLNAWYDGLTQSRSVLKEVNLGIAMDTADGLFLPVIQNAHLKKSSELKEAIDSLKSEVFDRTIAPEKLQNPSIVLSNFGKFSGRFATPIVVPPTVAILAVGSFRCQPVVQAGTLSIGQVLPLSLTVDHRAITGGEATRFLGALIACLVQKKERDDF